MQVAPGFLEHGVWLLESDYLSLSSNFAMQEAGLVLVDRQLEAHHQLTPAGFTLLRACAPGMSLGNLRKLAAWHDVSPSQLHELLGFLNSVGALEVARRGWRARLQTLLTRLWLLGRGLRYPSLVWRRDATTRHLAQAVWRVSWPVGLGALAAGGLVAASGLSTVWTTAGATGLAVLLFGSSLYVHELGHLVAIYRSGARVALVQQGLRLGLLHRQLTAPQEVISALSGPTAGLLWCCLWGTVIMMTDNKAFALMAYGLAAFHLASFLPRYGDGLSLIRALTRVMKPTI